MEKRKPRCHNCVHAGQQFKIDKLTHLHCEHPIIKKKFENGEFKSPFDSLMVFSNTCEIHEFKPSN